MKVTTFQYLVLKALTHLLNAIIMGHCDKSETSKLVGEIEDLIE
jgi:hypothetical protein